MSQDPTLADTSFTIPGRNASRRTPSSSSSRGVFLMRTFTCQEIAASRAPYASHVKIFS
jgi:hypothetical protein